MSPRLAIGVGCRRACPTEAIRAVIEDACAGLDLVSAGLFTHVLKRDEVGLHQAAAALGLPLRFFSAVELAAVTEQVTHHSRRVESATGTPSIAEAAALAGAGWGSRLIIPRRAHAAATCAVAMGPGTNS